MTRELYNAASQHGKIVALMLEIKGLPFVSQIRDNELITDFPNEATLKDVGPLIHGTHIILDFLEDKYPWPQTFPAEPDKRCIVSMLLRSLLTSDADNPFDFSCYKEELRDAFICGEKPCVLDIAIAATAPREEFWDTFRTKLYDAFQLEREEEGERGAAA